MALTKVSGGILDPGINVAGIVTATGFDGPFTGGSTKNITAGVVTATSLDLNGNGDISGNLVIGGNLTANGDFTTLNTTLREVEILRVDASSGEPAGIITQTGAGDILRLYDGASQVVTVLDTGEVGIGTINPSSYGGAVKLALHSSGHTGLTIAAGTGSDGNIFFADGVSGDTTYRGNIKYAHNGDSMRFHTAAEERLRITSGGDLRLGLDSVANVTDSAHYIMTLTGKSGQTGAGAIAFRDPSANTDGFIFADSGNLFITADYDNTTADSSIRFRVDGSSEKLRITSGGQVRIANTDLTASASADDLIVGTTSGSRGLTIFSGTGNTGNIFFADTDTSGVGNRMGTITYDHSGNYMRFSTSGNQEKVRILSTGEVGIGITNPSDMLHVVGSGKFIKTSNNYVHVGSSNAGGAAIVLDGDSNGDGVGADYAYIEHDTSGDLNIVVDNPANAGNIKFWTNTSEERLRILSDGAIRIPDGSNSTSRLLIGSGAGALYVYHDGNTKFENATGYLKLQCNNKLYIDGSELFFRNAGGTNRWRILTTGHLVPGAAGTYDIGSTSAEVGHIYVADSKTIWVGSDQDLRIAHDPTHTVSYIQNTGTFQIQTDDLKLFNYSTADLYLRAQTNSSVQLFYDYSTHTTPKLETSATGITVDGEVSASQDYPNFRPTLDLNFTAEKKLDSRITYFRSGPASFVNEFGKVVLVSDNAPRFDHDPITGESKGLLIEESRTNIQPYSQDLSNWTVESGGSVTANTHISPAGDQTADSLNGTQSGSSAYRTFALTSGTPYTFTIFLKYVSGNTNIQIQIGDAPFTRSYTTFNTSTGALVSNTGGTATVNDVVSYGNGWYRYSITRTPTSTANGFMDINHTSSTASTVAVWGAQIEAGSFATSYIPTTDATNVTRGYEAVTLEGTDFSDVFGTEFKEFSLVADYDNTQTTDGTGHAIIDLWGEAGGYDDRIEWFKNSASPYHLATRAFGQGNPIFANGELSASTKAKTQRFATSWYVPDYSNTSSRRFAVSMGGEAVDVVNDSSGTTVPQITRMGIGCNPTRLDFSPGLLHFKRLMVYNKTLSDGQLQNLSAQ
jgi:hypothetical protein